MAGTISGGKLAAQKNLEKNPNFYKEIGSTGGKNGKGSKKGFAANPELARKCGALGGSISRRTKSKKDE